MKILVLSNMYPSKHSKTFGIFVKNQVELLRELGVQVDVIGIGDPRRGKKAVLTKYFTFFLKGIINLLFKGHQYDAVHVHYLFPTGVLGLLYKKLWKKKLIVTSHGGDIDQMVKKSDRVKDWTKKILDQSDHVIVVGEGLKRNVIETFGTSKDKLSVINMGVNRDVFKPKNREQLRNAHTIDQDETVLLFVGNLIRQKGLDELFDAMKNINLSNVSLHLLGEAKDQAYFKELSERVKDEGLPVVFHGGLSQAEVSDWMNIADVFILPSHIEGFGLVALEAMACGTPVIGSDVGGLSYLLADEAGMKIEPKNQQALSIAIEQLFMDQSLQDRLIENGFKKAEDYDQKKLVQQIIQLYETK